MIGIASLSVHGYIVRPTKELPQLNPIGPGIKDIHNIIRCKIEEFLIPLNGCPTQYDNAPFDKPTNSCWLRATILFDDVRQADTGAKLRRYRTTGMLIFNIFTPTNTGDNEDPDGGNEIMDQITQIFRSADIGGIQFKVPKPGTRRRQSDEWMVNLNCPFYADQLG